MSGSGAIRRKDWSEKEGARGTVPTAPLRSTHLGAKLGSCEIKKKAFLVQASGSRVPMGVRTKGEEAVGARHHQCQEAAEYGWPGCIVSLQF